MSALHKRFLFVTGKGGVGKTSFSLALARALATAGRRVLLAAPDPAAYRQCLPKAAFNLDPTLAGPRLWTVHLDAAEAIQEYGRLIIKARLARHALFGNRPVRTFLAAVPGLYPWAELGKAWYHTTEVVDGEPRFDTVVFDAPATGHGLEMLRLPRVLSELAPAGVMRRDAQLAWQLFQDPERSGVVLVTLPEELPVNEALEMHEQLATELKLPVAAVVINRVRECLFSAAEQALLVGLPELANPSAADRVLDSAALSAFRERTQHRARGRLRELPAPLFELPELESADTEGARLAQIVQGQLARRAP